MKTNTSNLQETGALSRAWDFVRHTGRNVFLTGKAGTGKTTFLHRIRTLNEKRMIVVAPTGVAAINAGGVTIHSFFQLPFGPQIPEEARQSADGRSLYNEKLPGGIRKFNREKLRIIRALDLLVIDEISMVRADLLDSVDEVLRKLRRSPLPFGGVQLLVIGDLFQLSPVVRDDDWKLLRDFYPSLYFFESRAYRRANFLTIELDHVFRQRDERFIRLLNAVRNNNVSPAVLEALHERYRPNSEEFSEGYIMLTTHNARANEINQQKLAALSTPVRIFLAVVEGDFPESSWPGEQELVLKEGAQVMFTKNDVEADRRFFNGKIGRVISFTEDAVMVRCEGDDGDIPVKPMTWFNHQYRVDESSMEVVEDVSGTFTQLPLKLAWAITIHKSQGLTFEHAIIDARAAFASGQVYVALSRCRSLEGLVLSSRIDQGGIITDQNVVEFTRQEQQSGPDETAYQSSRHQYQLSLIHQLFDFSALQRQYKIVQRQLETHSASIEQQTLAPFHEFAPALAEIKQVAERFLHEINRLASGPALPEDNPQLQDRLSKAAAWFLARLQQTIGAFLPSFMVVTDNTTVRKLLRESLDALRKELRITTSCLQGSARGFRAVNYLQLRGKSMLEQSIDKVTKSEKDALRASALAHPGLFATLMEWRDKTAGELGISNGRVVPYKTMMRIAEVLPTDEKNLSSLKGFSKKMTKAYGAMILSIVRHYCETKDIHPKESLNYFEEHRKKNAGTDSQKISFDFFSQGKSIAEIAAIRGLAKSTIETHLSHFVETGQLDAHLVVEESKYERIAEYFLSPENTDSLSMAKDFLGEDVSYAELRFVLRHLHFLHRKTN